VLLHDWSTLLFLEGLTILGGCTLVNLWQVADLGTLGQWGLIGITKVIQVALMLFWVARYRPFTGDFTSAERQIWALVPAYYGGCLAAVFVNASLERPVPLAPFLAVLSGVGFVSLGASIWGWLALWGLGFFALAVVLAWTGTSAGMTLLGVGWFVCLLSGSLYLRGKR